MVALRVYVAGPIGPNDASRLDRLRAAIDAGRRLLVDGLEPFVPHLWAAACEADGFADYERWLEYDLAWLDLCQAVLRLPGDSPGADRECLHARDRGIPVFGCIDDVVVWGAVMRRQSAFAFYALPGVRPQPAPHRSTGPAVWPLVMEDMRARDELGRHRYGTPLQASNGRDALIDAYHEALDLVVYLRQAIQERALEGQESAS